MGAGRRVRGEPKRWVWRELQSFGVASRGGLVPREGERCGAPRERSQECGEGVHLRVVLVVVVMMAAVVGLRWGGLAGGG